MTPAVGLFAWEWRNYKLLCVLLDGLLLHYVMYLKNTNNKVIKYFIIHRNLLPRLLIKFIILVRLNFWALEPRS
jgi:hypothetical protein